MSDTESIHQDDESPESLLSILLAKLRRQDARVVELLQRVDELQKANAARQKTIERQAESIRCSERKQSELVARQPGKHTARAAAAGKGGW